MRRMPIEPRIYPEPQPDRLQAVVRGVCGGLLGAVVAAVAWMRNGSLGFVATIVLFAACIAVCTLGAIRHGDAFWVRVLRRRR